MVETVTVREVQCRLCGYVKRLRPLEAAPATCPSCNDGKAAKWEGRRTEDTWSA